MKKPPCYKCTKRYSTCHDTCKDYIKWHKELREEKMKLAADSNDYRSSATIKHHRKNKVKKSAPYMKNKFQEKYYVCK